jgi:hypothetical protein
MNLSSISKTILTTENGMKVDDLSNQIEVSEAGLQFLQEKLIKLNQKAERWGVPKMELKILNQREQPVMHWNPIFGNEKVESVKIFYTISIEGNTPKIEGFTFIAKIQHTTGGDNILNIAPNSPIKNLPDIYRTTKAECDVCNQARLRFNTFILRVDKEDPERFADKKIGDLIQVGSDCLIRFLPSASVGVLMRFAQLLDEVRQFRDGSTDWDDESYSEDGVTNAPNPTRHHANTDLLLKYIALVYVTRGKYIPKSKAGLDSKPTSDEALLVMNDREGKMYVSGMIQKNPQLVIQADELSNNVSHWMKKTDFNQLNQNPEWSNYYGNLNVVAHAPTISTKNIGYLGGVLQSFLRYEREKTKSESPKAYVGQTGDKIHFNGQLVHQKSMPSQYQRGTFITIYEFEDLDGNILKWFASKSIALKIGERYPLSATVKKHEVDKFSKQPTTYITHAKLERM